MSGNIETIREELGGLITPVTAASLASAYFTARSLPENRDANPEKVLAEVIEIYKACRFECEVMRKDR